MILIGCFFIYLAIARKFEPLLLVPIGFGILIGNVPYDTSRLSLGVYDGPTSETDLHYYQVLMAGMREAISSKQFEAFAKSFHQQYNSGDIDEPDAPE